MTSFFYPPPQGGRVKRFELQFCQNKFVFDIQEKSRQSTYAIIRAPHDGASWQRMRSFISCRPEGSIIWSPHSIMRAPHDGALMPSLGLPMMHLIPWQYGMIIPTDTCQMASLECFLVWATIRGPPPQNWKKNISFCFCFVVAVVVFIIVVVDPWT